MKIKLLNTSQANFNKRLNDHLAFKQVNYASIEKTVDKILKKIEENELQASVVQRRGIQTTKNLEKGSILKASDIFPLRPCTENSIEPHHMDSIVGKTLINDLKEGQYLQWKDLS